MAFACLAVTSTSNPPLATAFVSYLAIAASSDFDPSLNTEVNAVTSLAASSKALFSPCPRPKDGKPSHQ